MEDWKWILRTCGTTKGYHSKGAATMSCDLARIFGNRWQEIAASPASGHLLTARALPSVPPELTTDRLYIQKGLHEYEAYYQVDLLHLFAPQATLGYLGLLILSVVFHPRSPKVRLRLAHPASEISTIVISYDSVESDRALPGYRTRPEAFSYDPAVPEHHPWLDLAPFPSELPCFYLALSAYKGGVEEDWKQRDTLLGFGTDHGCIRFAKLLLDLSLTQNQVDEIALESEAGFRGVGRASAELTIHLPGSVAWDPEQWISD